MKTIAAILLLTTGLFLNSEFTNDHLRVFEGDWEGELTYLNYGDDETLVTLPMTVEAEFNHLGLKFVYLFTEPGGRIEKRTDRFQLRKKDIFYNGSWQLVTTEVVDLENWKMELESTGKDNNKKAEFKKLVNVSADKIMVTKMVRYDGTDDFFVRNKYVFER